MIVDHSVMMSSFTFTTGFLEDKDIPNFHYSLEVSQDFVNVSTPLRNTIYHIQIHSQLEMDKYNLSQSNAYLASWMSNLSFLLSVNQLSQLNVNAHQDRNSILIAKLVFVQELMNSNLRLRMKKILHLFANHAMLIQLLIQHYQPHVSVNLQDSQIQMTPTGNVSAQQIKSTMLSPKLVTAQQVKKRLAQHVDAYQRDLYMTKTQIHLILQTNQDLRVSQLVKIRSKEIPILHF